MTGDRYNVPSTPGSDLEQRLRDLEQRVDAQFNRTLRHSVLPEGSVTILNAAGDTRAVIDGGGLRLYDDAGILVLDISGTGLRMYDAASVLRARVGYINATAGYGVSIFDENAGLRFEVNDDGYRDPYLALAPVDNNAFDTVTSGSFVDTKWIVQSELIGHKGLYLHVAASGDAGTTGEIRLANESETQVTSAVSVPAAGFVFKQFKWLHGATLGTGPVTWRVQARRTGGAGNINVYSPTSVALVDPSLCTSGGT